MSNDEVEMKWYFLVWGISAAYGGPFDTQGDCVKALAGNEPYIGDPLIHNPPIVPFGLCVQGVTAQWVPPKMPENGWKKSNPERK